MMEFYEKRIAELAVEVDAKVRSHQSILQSLQESGAALNVLNGALEEAKHLHEAAKMIEIAEKTQPAE